MNVSRFKVLLALSACLVVQSHAAEKIAKDTVVIAVAPNGDDSGAGTPASPFRTPERAQQAVRLVSDTHDVIVQLADGTYRFSRTLVFKAEDGGRDGHTVTWQAAAGAKPVFSGGLQVTGWRLADKAQGIYVADTPKGLDSRQLWVNDEMMTAAAVEIPRSAVEFTRQGIVLKDPKYAGLSKLPDQGRLEVTATGFFTKRVSPVDHIEGNTLVMKQPAWDNNIWGYDALSTPYHPELAHLYLANSLAFLKEPGQWYLDPSAGKLYLRPPAGVDVAHMDVELPSLDRVDVGGQQP